MGLDMWLYRGDKARTYNDEDGKTIYSKFVTDDFENFDRIDGVECAYWRKANQVHRWFVENVQDGEDDCGYYEVTIPQLRELLAICHKLMSEEATTEDAEELLPTQDGFFFGGTEYDDYYYSDIQITIDQLEKALAEAEDDEKAFFVYTSSW